VEENLLRDRDFFFLRLAKPTPFGLGIDDSHHEIVPGAGMC